MNEFMSEDEVQGKVLLVEDDPTILRLLDTQLSARGWLVSVATGAREALAAVTTNTPDIVLLDIGLSEGDGLSVCRSLREWSSVPILIVTAADSPRIKVAALEMGADDYLTKPFHTGELVARMRAVLRRTQLNPVKTPSEVKVGALAVNFAQREARIEDKPIRLTKIEFDLLRELMLHIDRVLTYAHLLQAVWGSGYDDIRVVHVHVSHLRRKLEPDITGPRYILTVPGVGYRFRSNTDQTT
jgi:two-component system, OmpR family, KDP operon response regulator KdpE